ncbi:MAG: pseudouridine synthase [Acidobacteriota bacterium]|nr:pseudouridine synthase [Acidobacteriota bacterium]
MESSPQRLQKILAAAGLASRRKAEELIAAGLVSVNGHVITEAGSKADPRLDEIRVDGKLLRGPERHVYLAVYKPKGYVTTVKDPEGRPTVMDLVKSVDERVFPVGRLDYMSEGLLLLTNDGDLMAELTKAGSHVAKTYMVKVAGHPTEEEIDRLREGIMLPPEPGLAGVRGKKQPGVERRSFAIRTQPAFIQLAVDQENPWYEVTLTEGRNRQIRRMFEQIDHHIEKIKRVRYGSLSLDLEPGEFRPLTPREVNQLRKSLETPFKPRVLKPKTVKSKFEGAPARLPRVASAKFVKGRRGKPSAEQEASRAAAPRREFKPREAGEFKPREGRDFKARGERELEPRGERAPKLHEFKTRDGAAFNPRKFRDQESERPEQNNPRAVRVFRADADGKAEPREESTFRPREERGFKPRGDRDFKPRAERPFKPRREGEEISPRGPEFKRPAGERRPFGEKKAFGAKPGFGARKDSGEKRSFGPRKEFGARKPFGEKKEFSSPREFGEKRFEKKTRFDEPRFEKPSFDGGEREFKPRGERPAFGERKPFGAGPAKFGKAGDRRFSRGPGKPAPRGEGSFTPRTEGGFKPRSEGGFKPRSEGGFKPRSEGGFKPRSEGGFKPRSEGGFKPRSEGGFKPRSEGGFKPRSGGGFKPRTGPGGGKPRGGPSKFGAPRPAGKGGKRPSSGPRGRRD